MYSPRKLAECDKFYFQECSLAFFNKTYSYPHSFLLEEYKKTDREKYEIIDGGKKADIDYKDLQILCLIALNARIPLTEIAEKLDVSTTMINYRIKKLIKIPNKHVVGYSLTIGYPDVKYKRIPARKPSRIQWL